MSKPCTSCLHCRNVRRGRRNVRYCFNREIVGTDYSTGFPHIKDVRLVRKDEICEGFMEKDAPVVILKTSWWKLLFAL